MYDTFVKNLEILTTMVRDAADRLKEQVEDEPFNLVLVPIYAMVLGASSLLESIHADASAMVCEWSHMNKTVALQREEIATLRQENGRLKYDNDRIRGNIGKQCPFPVKDLDPAAKFMAVVGGPNNTGRKIPAIKKAREMHGLGLADAKNLVEVFCDSLEADRYRNEAMHFIRMEVGTLTDGNIEQAAEKWASPRRPSAVLPPPSETN